jgi:hypothetical protein
MTKPVDSTGGSLADLFTDDIRRLFYEVGMAAAVMGKKFEANLLFFNLLEADCDSAYPLLGLGYCRMMAGSFGEAHALLQEPRVVNSPLADVAVSLRALAFHLEGRKAEMDELLKNHPTSQSAEALRSALKPTAP